MEEEHKPGLTGTVLPTGNRQLGTGKHLMERSLSISAVRSDCVKEESRACADRSCPTRRTTRRSTTTRRTSPGQKKGKRQYYNTDEQLGRLLDFGVYRYRCLVQIGEKLLFLFLLIFIISSVHSVSRRLLSVHKHSQGGKKSNNR